MNYVHGTTAKTRTSQWPGFDWDFYAHACAVGRRTTIQRELDRLGERHTFSGRKPTPFAPPVLINRHAAAKMRAFCAAYHRLITSIVANYQTDSRLQETISLPGRLAKDALRDQKNVQNNVTLCRIDFYLHSDGGFSVLETNANCPGLLFYAGIGAAFWRGQLRTDMPAPLLSENQNWFSDWYLQAAQDHTGTQPEELAILYQEGGHRLELAEIGGTFRDRGIDVREMDPRKITPQDIPTHAYLKLSVPEFTQMGDELNTFVDAIFAGDLYIQNGLLGRWIGDNKLCLAVISDPAFADLFDPNDLDTVAAHIPWSRNIAHCTFAEITRIQSNPRDYVLKRPLDTRGRGVVIGREVTSDTEWATAVGVAINEGWLVMRHVDPTYIASKPDDPTLNRHDLALGLINGKIASGFVRSSPEMRVNVARSGRMHSIYLAD